jgi:hypothetical protein
MPSMQKLYDDYQNKIVFLFVTTDSFEKANAFLIKESLNLFINLDKSPLELESSTIPLAILLIIMVILLLQKLVQLTGIVIRSEKVELLKQ